MIKCNNKLCKYHDHDGEEGCLWFYMGSGDPSDLPCTLYSEAPLSEWETVKANPNMIHCVNCKGIWWNKKFRELFKYCPECGARIDGWVD